jgi:hypothetical protein
MKILEALLLMEMRMKVQPLIFWIAILCTIFMWTLDATKYLMNNLHRHSKITLIKKKTLMMEQH